jgi:hypothetical protein
MNSSDNNPFIRYYIGSRSFLERSQALLSVFDDTEDVSALLGAALQLRFGIEARLHEYLSATLRQLGREKSRIREYTASDLLKRLTREDPRAEHATHVRITQEQAPFNSTGMSYTPITKDLATTYGRLSDVLHYSFFPKRPGWMVRARSSTGSVETLLDARDIVALGIEQLTLATRGTLLAHPRFTALVRDLDDSGGGDELGEPQADAT